MGFSMFSGQTSPIAIDFGSASVKLLQTASGERPSIIAAANLTIPDTVRSNQAKLFTFYEDQLPRILSSVKFKGKRAVLAVPNAQTFVQHMQIPNIEGAGRDDLIKNQLQTQMGCSPDGVVVRWIDVTEVHRDGQNLSEVICLAIARETVMRYLNLLKKCKLKVVGVHTKPLAIVRAFDHLAQSPEGKEFTTLFVDLGWGGTQVAIAHGSQAMFARQIQIGGRHFDHLIATTLNCDPVSARAHRLAVDDVAGHGAAGEGPLHRDPLLKVAAHAEASDKRRHGDSAPAGATSTSLVCEIPASTPPRIAANVDMSELLDTITDEVSMCLRYHQGLFPERTIDRAIFVGGESRQMWLCNHLVNAVRCSAQLGNPIARMSCKGASTTPDMKLDEPQPGFAVACGLCSAPTDL